RTRPMGCCASTTGPGNRRGGLEPRMSGVPGQLGGTGDATGDGRTLLVETTTLVDGRVFDAEHKGRLSGTLVVPRFIVDEIEQWSESAEAGRSYRGRHAAEVLRALREDPDRRVEILEEDRGATGVCH